MNTCKCLTAKATGNQAKRIGRRGFLRLSAISAGALFYRKGALAGGTADVLLLSCMDFRLVDDLTRFMDGRGLTNKYDHIVLAGASAGAISEQFKDWHSTFWSHLKVAIDLHHIHKVMIIDHRDCGAYKIAFGAEHASDPDIEGAVHGAVLAKLEKSIKAEYPKLQVETYLMALDGSVESIGHGGECRPASGSEAKAKQQTPADHEESHDSTVASNEPGEKSGGGSLFPEN